MDAIIRKVATGPRREVSRSGARGIRGLFRLTALVAGAILVAGVKFGLAQEEMVGPVMANDQPDWWGGPGVSGDWGEWRELLSDHGVEIFANYTVDIFGNVSGGEQRGAAYAGLLQFGTELDLEKLVGWRGASLSSTWLWLSGRDASADLVGNFLTVSNIAGFETLRMFELWGEQTWWDERISLRVGQLAADSEFIISQYAALFINGTFGWPAFTYMNLPEGGPGYPMGTLGARLSLQPSENITLMGAVFQGNVFAQEVNRHGFRYRLNAETGYTFLQETQLRWPQDSVKGLGPGQAKLGFWWQSGSAADALTTSTTSGNVGVYGIIDQLVFRELSASPRPVGKNAPETKNSVAPPPDEPTQGLGVFARMALAPADRNVVNFYFDTGLNYTGLLPTREADVFGLAWAYAQISPGAWNERAAEQLPAAGAEMVLEATYQAQINPWLILQPDLQLIIQPNATQVGNPALLLGIRGQIDF